MKNINHIQTDCLDIKYRKQRVLMLSFLMNLTQMKYSEKIFRILLGNENVSNKTYNCATVFSI